jgi:hypothetical protein
MSVPSPRSTNPNPAGPSAPVLKRLEFSRGLRRLRRRDPNRSPGSGGVAGQLRARYPEAIVQFGRQPFVGAGVEDPADSRGG